MADGAVLLALQVAVNRDRAAARRDRNAADRDAAAALAAGAEFDRLADWAFRAAMHLAGYAPHHRGEQRRT